ncbi:MAG: hypothetical protein ABI587_10580 [Gemmatimonadales bacterium]
MTRLSLFATLLLAACSSAPAGIAAARGDGFQYTARSAAGQSLLTGRLQLAFPDDSTVTGTWTIAWVPGADTTMEVGPQVGAGILTGSRSGDTLRLQLNPNMADNNVGLRAVRTAEGYAGEWEWVAFTGPRSGGSFVAGRQ